MKKLLVLPAVLLLTGCTVMDVVGPRPNSEIMALAKQASADWVFGSDDTPEWREMRKFHSEQLKDEALRLCGTDETGATPSTCDVGYGDTDLPASESVNELVGRTVAAARKVPDESVDLVVAQAIDALALAPVSLAPAPIAGEGAGDGAGLSDDADIAAAHDMLARENALYYGLGLALAYADEGLRSRIGTLREASHERVNLLVELIPAGEGASTEALAPAAGYTFAEGYAEPTSPESAAQLVETMHNDLVTQWRRTAADANSPAWLSEAIALAAHAQRAG